MTDEMSSAEAKTRVKSGFHVHGHVICSHCDERVEFERCETVGDAVDIWNSHAYDCFADDEGGNE